MTGANWDETCPATRGRGTCTCEGYEPFVAAGAGEREARLVPESAIAAERARIIAVARQMGAVYPVTLEPEPGSERAVTRAHFPFADYLEDVPVERQGKTHREGGA